MADPDQLRASGTRAQRRDLRVYVGREIDPADDAGDELVRGRGREELARLVLARSRLHQDRAVDPVRGEQRPQVRGPERPADRRELVGHPRVRGPRGIPEVVVRVDGDHRHAAPPGNA